MNPLFESHVPGVPCRRGKVRDVYDLGDRLVIVASDRISAFDWVLPTPIADKGRILTSMSRFWFDFLGAPPDGVPNHILSMDVADLPASFTPFANELGGRTMLVKKTEVTPIECVVRGYLAGSGWKEYRQSGTVCGIALPAGLKESERLPEAIFTPATKADSGHDENISFATMAERVGVIHATELRDRSIAIYEKARDYAAGRGIILADTKFEWGRLPSGDIILIDEVLTPDSSRYWPVDGYRVGAPPASFDKQFVRDWLDRSGWDKNSPPPALPDEVVAKTRDKYLEAHERLVGKVAGTLRVPSAS